MIRRLLFIALCAVLFFACSSDYSPKADYRIIPQPKYLNTSGGDGFMLSSNTIVAVDSDDDSMLFNATCLADYLHRCLGSDIQVKQDVVASSDVIRLALDTTLRGGDESYRIVVNSDCINVYGASAAGVFYGIQTLRKSLPVGKCVDKVCFPAVEIMDYPRFGYRGMHLDVARHFMPMDSIFQYVDMIAMHNMNRLHLHLTDDQGWRMEVKKYPELTQVGSVRHGTVIGRNSGEYDTITYGGFYTQEELKSLVEYAADRYITIIPEIDLPGHQLAALATYPDLGCTGGPYEVWRQWGVADDVICAGNEDAMRFLEDVLTELIDIFPSEYIHIGGDECPKVRWQNCPKCQNRINSLALKADDKHSAEEYLQSYVIQRMERFLESKGRHIIGWDEILEGGLAPNATVMSWRGTQGGIDAARLGHDVIMTPNNYLYFDYYQSTDTENEPLAIGGYVPVEKVYSFEPMADELSVEERKHIIGVQANIWTEYIKSFRHLQYMVLPRMAALSEVQWCDPQQKDYEDFVTRCYKLIDLYKDNGYRYAEHIFDIQAAQVVDTEREALVVTLSKCGEGEIRYSTDGTDPAVGAPYVDPIVIDDDVTLQAVVIRPTGKGRPYSATYSFSKSSLKPITLKNEPHKSYAFEGASILNDGLYGNGNYKTGRWLGFWGEPIDATIDFKAYTEISELRFQSNVVKGDWIYNPKSLKILVSDDGVAFNEIASQEFEQQTWDDLDGVYPYQINFDPIMTRYLKVIITPFDLPNDHPGFGYPAYVFVDELVVF